MVVGWMDFSYADANLDNVAIETCNPDGTPNGFDENQNGATDEGCVVIVASCTDGIDNETPTQIPALADGVIDNCPVGPNSNSVSVSLSTNQSAIQCGSQSATLTWTTNNATSCTGSGGFGFTTTPNASGGSDTVSGMSSISNQFEITCAGPNGPATAYVIVQCLQPQPIELCGPYGTGNQIDDDGDDLTDEGCVGILPPGGGINPIYQER
jgi:hypothetical protein